MPESSVEDVAYRKTLRSWMIYDWANSAFATTVLAAVFPIYYSVVAGSTLPSRATATLYYTLTLSASVLVTALISPILGAIADGKGTRKRWLLIFAFGGAAASTALYTVGAGDWLVASIIFGLARIGFGGSVVFYDALLPHVAKPEDVDSTSSKGYAIGYLGGGILLIANVALIFALPDDGLGVRISLASVGLWWALFTIPLIRNVPEPPPVAGGAQQSQGLAETARSLGTELKRTLGEIRRLPDLARFLIAFLIYNDAIGVVISVATIYGVELRFGAIELTLAILMVQFVGIPYALAFGAMPTAEGKRRAVLLAFVVANIVLLPIYGLSMRVFGPADVGGVAPADFEQQGVVELGAEEFPFVFNWDGQSLIVTNSGGPGFTDLQVVVDGETVLDGDEPLLIEAKADVARIGDEVEIEVAEPGPHTLELVPVDPGGRLNIERVEVLPPPRQSNLGVIILGILAVQVVAAVFAIGPGSSLLGPLSTALTTKGAIILALCAYVVIAFWGFALDSVVEFWGLAWLVAVCQGGSQALSRSLFTRLIPLERSGEYFGFFSIISKFASFFSPLLFVASVLLFNSSRPAVGLLSVFFGVGIWLLRGVDVERGQAAVSAPLA